MKKYLYIFKSELMSNLQYIGNTLVGFIGYSIMIFIFLNLWNYIYSDASELINGYTKTQMIWYVIITEIIWKCTSGRSFCKKIIDDVKSGNIAYTLNKPYSYVGYALSSHLGSSAITAVLYIPLGLILGVLFLKSIPVLNLLQVIIILISGTLAVVISSLLIILIGLFSFVIEDANPIFWIHSKIILILGTLFPVEYFPAFLQPLIIASPIFVTCYGPARLFVNFTWETCASVIIAQIIYVIAIYLLCSLIYRKGVKRINVNGG